MTHKVSGRVVAVQSAIVEALRMMRGLEWAELVELQAWADSEAKATEDRADAAECPERAVHLCNAEILRAVSVGVDGRLPMSWQSGPFVAIRSDKAGKVKITAAQRRMLLLLADNTEPTPVRLHGRNRLTYMSLANRGLVDRGVLSPRARAYIAEKPPKGE